MAEQQSLTYTPSLDVVCTPLDDGEAVLLHLSTREYYTLNETGSLVWALVEEGISEGDMVDRITVTFEISQEEARAQVAEYLANLMAEGLIDVRKEI